MKDMILQCEIPEQREQNVRKMILKILRDNECTGIEFNGNPYPDTPYYEEKGIKIPSFMKNGGRRI